MPLSFVSAKVNNGAHEEASKGRQADFEIGRQRVGKSEDVTSILIKAVLCSFDGKTKQHGTIAAKNAYQDGQQGQINVLVKTPSAEGLYDSLIGFYRTINQFSSPHYPKNSYSVGKTESEISRTKNISE